MTTESHRTAGQNIRGAPWRHNPLGETLYVPAPLGCFGSARAFCSNSASRPTGYLELKEVATSVRPPPHSVRRGTNGGGATPRPFHHRR